MEKFLVTMRKIINSIPGQGVLSSLMLLSSFFAPFSSFPSVQVYVKEGRDKGLYILLIGSVVTFLLGGVEAGILYVVVIAACSVVTSELLLSKYNFGKTIFYGTLIIIGIYAVAIILYTLILNVNPVELISSKVMEALKYLEAVNPELITQMLRESGMTKQELVTSIVIKVPSTIVISIVLLFFINLIMMSRFDLNLAKYLSVKSLYSFKVSDYFIWPAIAFGALYLYSDSELNSSVILKLTALLLFKSILIVYFFQGLAIMYLFLSNGIKSLFIRSLLFSVIIVFAYIFITIIGFFDTWFNFRKYIKSREDKGEMK